MATKVAKLKSFAFVANDDTLTCARIADYFEKRGVDAVYLERVAHLQIERGGTNRFMIEFYLPDGKPLMVQRPDGSQIHFNVFRNWDEDIPKSGSNAGRKFVQPPGVYSPLYFAHLPRKFKRALAKLVKDASAALIVTEGVSKAMAIAQHGGLAVAVLGCHNWRQKNGEPVPEWNQIALKGREVVIVYDADAANNVDVQDGLLGLRDMLTERGARVSICLLDPVNDDPKTGADDFIAVHGYKTFEKFVREHKLPADDQKFEEWGSRARLDWMNRRHAVVMTKTQALILTEDPAELRLSRPRDLEPLYANQFVGTTPLLDWWITHEKRRTYERIVFDPSNEAAETDYNLYGGFAVQPKRGKCDLFLRHVRENIAQGDKGVADYLIAWLADAVQNPSNRSGVALVLRGPQGVGKGVFAKVFGSLFGAHFVHVTSSRGLTGRFNAHLAGKLIVFADEAVWAGDKGAEGILRGLITEEPLQIEQKGKDVFTVDNFLRFIIATNHDWAVPAGPWERRFFVIEVGDKHMQDTQYFSALMKQMGEGGREALLHYLLHYDLSRVDVRNFPKTAALWEQKSRSMSRVQEFWFETLNKGRLLSRHDGWERSVSKEALHIAFLNAARDTGDRRRAAESEFGKEIRKLCPEIRARKKWNRTTKKQERVYELPPLETCRTAFVKFMGQNIEWEDG